MKIRGVKQAACHAPLLFHLAYSHIHLIFILSFFISTITIPVQSITNICSGDTWRCPSSTHRTISTTIRDPLPGNSAHLHPTQEIPSYILLTQKFKLMFFIPHFLYIHSNCQKPTSCTFYLKSPMTLIAKINLNQLIFSAKIMQWILNKNKNKK